MMSELKNDENLSEKPSELAPFLFRPMFCCLTGLSCSIILLRIVCLAA